MYHAPALLFRPEREVIGMKRSEIEGLVMDFAQEAVEDTGLEVLSVHYDREGSENYLRIYIDKSEGVSLDDCTLVSERVGERLDAVDPIPDSYILEVSSSGDMPLRGREDFVKFSGRYANIGTYKPVEGRKEFYGTILGVEDENLLIDDEGRSYRIPISEISRARLTIKV